MKNIRNYFWEAVVLFISSSVHLQQIAGSLNVSISNLSKSADGFFNDYTGWFKLD